MAAGDAGVTLTNVGAYDISGAALKTVVDGLSLKSPDLNVSSGGGLFFIPSANGQQVQVLKVVVA